MTRKYYKIEDCITLHDVKQIQKEPPGKKIKTMNQLARRLAKLKSINGTVAAIYSKLSRYQSKGFENEDENLTKGLLKVLEVKKEELIKKS